MRRRDVQDGTFAVARWLRRGTAHSVGTRGALQVVGRPRRGLVPVEYVIGPLAGRERELCLDSFRRNYRAVSAEELHELFPASFPKPAPKVVAPAPKAAPASVPLPCALRKLSSPGDFGIASYEWGGGRIVLLPNAACAFDLTRDALGKRVAADDAFVRGDHVRILSGAELAAFKVAHPGAVRTGAPCVTAFTAEGFWMLLDRGLVRPAGGDPGPRRGRDPLPGEHADETLQDLRAPQQVAPPPEPAAAEVPPEPPRALSARASTANDVPPDESQRDPEPWPGGRHPWDRTPAEDPPLPPEVAAPPVAAEPVAAPETAIVQVMVEGWPLGRLEGEDEPRVRDVDLGERLGYERPRKIREVIARLKEIGEITNVYVRPTVGRTSMPNGGTREEVVHEAWLTEEQALHVVMASGTPKAVEVKRQMVRVFMAARRGDLARQDSGRDAQLADAFKEVAGAVRELSAATREAQATAEAARAETAKIPTMISDALLAATRPMRRGQPAPVVVFIPTGWKVGESCADIASDRLGVVVTASKFHEITRKHGLRTDQTCRKKPHARIDPETGMRLENMLIFYAPIVIDQVESIIRNKTPAPSKKADEGEVYDAEDEGTDTGGDTSKGGAP